jgi:hypothetical protein
MECLRERIRMEKTTRGLRFGEAGDLSLILNGHCCTRARKVLLLHTHTRARERLQSG